MEKCKYCQEELAEDSLVCPHCGKDNAEQETDPVEEVVVVEEAPAAEETDPVEESAPAEEAAAGEEAAPARIKEGAKATPAKIALAVAAVVVLLAALIALIVAGLNGEEAQIPENTEATAATEETVVATIPADGNPDDATCKGSYTVSDEEAAASMDTVVATIGDKQLTNGQLQIYYWSVVNSYLSSDFGSYMMYYGMLDYTQPLDTQIAYEDASLTWQQFFLQEALEYWQMNQGMALEAQAAGMEMTQEERDYLDDIVASLEETAAYYGMESVDELLLMNFGPGTGTEEFAYFQELYYQGKPYYDAEMAKFVPTQENLEAFFAEHEEEYASGGITKDGKTVDVRHILVFPEGADSSTIYSETFSDEAWAAGEAKAQEILNEWLAGEATEDTFAAMANEHSADPGSNTNGGLYTGVMEGDMVAEFEEWCFDESRQIGDYGIVKTDLGYHIMYFSGSAPIWESYAESDWINEQSNQMIAALADNHPMEVDYSAIKLGYVSLGS